MLRRDDLAVTADAPVVIMASGKRRPWFHGLPGGLRAGWMSPVQVADVAGVSGGQMTAERNRAYAGPARRIECIPASPWLRPPVQAGMITADHSPIWGFVLAGITGWELYSCCKHDGTRAFFGRQWVLRADDPQRYWLNVILLGLFSLFGLAIGIRGFLFPGMWLFGLP